MEGLVAGAGILVAIIVLVVGALVMGGFILLAAKILDVHGRTYGKSLLSAVVSFIATLLVNVILTHIPILGWILSIIAGFIIAALVIQYFFKTTFGKGLGVAVIAWILTLIVGVIVSVIMGLILGTGLALMHGAGA